MDVKRARRIPPASELGDDDISEILGSRFSDGSDAGDATVGAQPQPDVIPDEIEVPEQGNAPGPARPAGEPPQQEPAENPPAPARRVRYADMTPRSKAKEKQRRIDQHRANSDKWHSKWVSKGVPKPTAGIADGASGSAGSAGNAEAAGRAEPHRVAPEQPPTPQQPEEISISEELMKEASCSKIMF